MRLSWPASHLNRVLLVGLPLAAIFALVTVGPDYRHHSPPATTGAGPPAAVQQAAPSPTTMDASARNNTRLADLVTLGKAMTELGRARGGYPSTKGLQTLCTYEEFDVGCALKSTMRDIPADPQ